MKRYLGFLLITICCLSVNCGMSGNTIETLSINQPDLTLWYTEPASQWIEALPIGNGRLGAMVYGTVEHERVQLNEESIWTGEKTSRLQEDAWKYVQEARKLLFDGKYNEAEKVMQDKVMGPRYDNNYHTYQTLGDLKLTFPGHGTYTDYKRSLSLDDAIAGVEYVVDGVKYKRQVFSSPVDQVIVVVLTSDKPGKITVDLAIDRPAEFDVKAEGNDMLIMAGHVTDGNGKGVRYESQLKAIPAGGTLQAGARTLSVKNADSLVLYLAAATNYRGEDPHVLCEKNMQGVNKDLKSVKNDHIKAHQELFGRVKLQLTDTFQDDIPTNQRLENVKNGQQDHWLETLYFQYGRYLLMSSSRPGCLPANLQGIWVDGLTPPWNSDYHININIQMNYWPAEVTNLSECHTPFFALIDSLRASGRRTAKHVYNSRGFTANHTTDVWWWTEPIGNIQYGMWPMSIGWCSQHLWEHYLYTGDKAFLQEAYPIMKEAALFFVDYMVKDPKTGYLVTGPSGSPENRFYGPSGEVAFLNMGTTVDTEIIYDLFSNCIEAADVLGTDAEFHNELVDLRKQLTPIRIGKDGRIMEWPHEFKEVEPGHRHVSHLFGLHPGRQITWPHTPELAQAAINTLDYRLANGGGHTGWSRAWIISFFSRLLQPERAYENLVALLAKSTLYNLFDTHPPFQIDGNFGGCAGITEMLMQSHAGEIHLLPALPDAWANGGFSGLKARGGFEFDVKWRDGAMDSVLVKSPLGGNCRIKSAVPLQLLSSGAFESAKGENPNPLCKQQPVPAIENRSAQLVEVVEKTWYVYDLKTDRDGSYLLAAQK